MAIKLLFESDEKKISFRRVEGQETGSHARRIYVLEYLYVDGGSELRG